MTINRSVFTRLALFVLAAIVPLLARDRPTITLDNRSGEDALVRLVGPTSGTVSVADSTRRAVEARGGTYRMYVRYGLPGKYRRRLVNRTDWEAVLDLVSRD